MDISSRTDIACRARRYFCWNTCKRTELLKFNLNIFVPKKLQKKTITIKIINLHNYLKTENVQSLCLVAAINRRF